MAYVMDLLEPTVDLYHADGIDMLKRGYCLSIQVENIWSKMEYRRFNNWISSHTLCEETTPAELQLFPLRSRQRNKLTSTRSVSCISTGCRSHTCSRKFSVFAVLVSEYHRRDFAWGHPLLVPGICKVMDHQSSSWNRLFGSPHPQIPLWFSCQSLLQHQLAVTVFAYQFRIPHPDYLTIMLDNFPRIF